MPLGEEPGERRRIDRLDLPAQPGQRSPAQQPEHLGVAPFPLRAARPELAPQQGSGRQQALEAIVHDACG